MHFYSLKVRSNGSSLFRLAETALVSLQNRCSRFPVDQLGPVWSAAARSTKLETVSVVAPSQFVVAGLEVKTAAPPLFDSNDPCMWLWRCVCVCVSVTFWHLVLECRVREWAVRRSRFKEGSSKDTQWLCLRRWKTADWIDRKSCQKDKFL